ncbi:MAG: hypothetical protein HeimC2_29240 [Candidatus Heimdallarchaeota archaeon LC_2]|nr:MAG: hypothetical protein HeimC2_29240 [Candidatus Heimdallarchaeota archaeon LC_2]
MSYMANTLEATKVNSERMQKQKERRKEKLLKFIMNNLGETAYSLSKKLEIPRTTILDILNELEGDLQIKYVELIEKGRTKKTIHTRTIDDFHHDRFNFEAINIPLIRRLVENAQRSEIVVTFDMLDGSTKILMPKDDLQKFIDNN